MSKVTEAIRQINASVERARADMQVAAPKITRALNAAIETARRNAGVSR